MGLAVSVTASASKSGKMVLNTKASGRTTKRMGKEPSGMQMATSTRESFATTNRMAMASFTAQMELFMKAYG